jgi:membrane protease YdiL (CAAX protease family)
MQTSSQKPQSGISNLWKRTPVFVKAVITGFFVCFSGITFWTTGYAILPLPYSLIYIVFFLVFYIYYCSGNGLPKSTSQIRKTNFRSVKLLPSAWVKGIAGALLFVIIVQSSLVITFRIIPFSEHAFKSQYPVFDTLPKLLSWALVIVSALVAGICEETGFRGYLQVPLENRYGAFRGIFFSSVLFMLVHLSKAWAGGIIIQIFFAGVLLGILAYKTGSLIPAIIGHVLLDVINFSYWWSHLAGNFSQKTIAQTGVDSAFIFWSLLFIVSVIGFLWIMAASKPVINKTKPAVLKSKQIFFAACAAAFVISFNSKKDPDTVAYTNSTKDTVSYPYKAIYSSDVIASSNNENLKKVLSIRKLFETNQIEAMKQYYADTVTYEDAGG